MSLKKIYLKLQPILFLQNIGVSYNLIFHLERLWIAVSALSLQNFRLQEEKTIYKHVLWFFFMKQMMRQNKFIYLFRAKLLTKTSQKCLMLYTQAVFSRYPGWCIRPNLLETARTRLNLDELTLTPWFTGWTPRFR